MVVTQRPLGNVDMMSAPIGHLAARVVEEPAELLTPFRREIGDVRRALPEIPVQAVHGLRSWERAERRFDPANRGVSLDVLSQPAALYDRNGLEEPALVLAPLLR